MGSVYKRRGSGSWIISWFDETGRRRDKSSKTTDHSAATRILSKIQADVELRKQGVIDVRLERLAQEAAKPISGHLDAYSEHQRGKSGLRHTDDTRTLIDAIVAHQGWQKLSDVDADGTIRFVAYLRSEGRSPRTIQKYLTAVKAFITWCSRNGRLSHNVLASVTKPNPETDRRIVRRYLGQDEFEWLDTVTRSSQTLYGLTGRERAVLYRFAIETGLRASELRSVTRGKLHLKEQPAFVLVAGASTKNKKQARQYFSTDLAQELSELVTKKLAGATVWALPSKFRLASMLHADMRAAREKWVETFPSGQERIEASESDFLTVTNSENEKLDFHSLRHTTASWLIAAGVNPKEVQTVMRHADIRMTMDRYGHLFEGSESQAVGKLSGMFRSQQAMKATGTDQPQQLPQQSGCNSVHPSASNHSKSQQLISKALAQKTDENSAESEDLAAKTAVKLTVARAGIEPATHGFSIRCSTN